jgi:uncharacterized ferritin-like protein (DUF455 family)
MELRQWALQILTGSHLEDKLSAPEILTDDFPGPPLFIDEPARSPSLALSRRSKEEKLPPFQFHHTQDARCLCLHRFCGHELLAVEMISFALLAYPEAPKGYRKSLVHHLKEEQSHVRLYQNRLKEMGVCFGDQPLFRHFWASTSYLYDVQHFISFMNLTLEQANLDFAPMYRHSFVRHGDIESARVMEKILLDEIGHVRLGIHWLKRLYPEKNDPQLFETWKSSLPKGVGPERGYGFVCYVEPRQKAGVPLSWIEALCPEKAKRTLSCSVPLSTSTSGLIV